MQGGRVAEGVRADGLGGERRQSGGRRRYVAFEDRPDAEAGDAFAVGVQEQWRVWLGAVCPLTEMATKCVRGLLPQRADPLFAEVTQISTTPETIYNYAIFLRAANRPDEAREWAQKLQSKKRTLPRYMQRRERPWFRKGKALQKELASA